MEILNQMVGGQRSGDEGSGQDDRHIIISTHDPLVIAGLEREQVQIFKRDPKTDKCYAEIPERSPKGMGFEGILTSDMFGFRSALDKPTLELLDRKRRLAIKEHLTDQEKRDLARIDGELGSIDFSNVVRDEYYTMFVRHMAEFEQREGISGQLLTAEQMELRKEHAKRIAAQLSELKKGHGR